MLVLASRSPRRKKILERAGLPAAVRVAEIDEARRDRESPAAYAVRLAREKAEAVEWHEGELILAADTIVVVDDEVLGKPRDAADAARMLAKLSGRDHRVITGICLRSAGRTVVDYAETSVRFVKLSPEEIDAYVASGEPLDKAGAYAVQGLASKFVERIEGCYFNVVGLPISLVYRLLKELRPASPDAGQNGH
ncbi:MAG: septum formation inhibitor Maf [Acidobacteria bacterium]|nr:septum formation inhibitor Maf [Acidobacteriota bacterium]MBI3279545.1 septum formation inhibitor Maf [Acidobacteriota bacterium]